MVPTCSERKCAVEYFETQVTLHINNCSYNILVCLLLDCIFPVTYLCGILVTPHIFISRALSCRV